MTHADAFMWMVFLDKVDSEIGVNDSDDTIATAHYGLGLGFLSVTLFAYRAALDRAADYFGWDTSADVDAIETLRTLVVYHGLGLYQ